MSNAEVDTSDLDNSVMQAEEMMQLFPWPIEMIAQLCKEIQEDSENGYY